MHALERGSGVLEPIPAPDSVAPAERREAIRRAAFMASLSLPVGAGASAYGFLESGGSHPSLKLGGAMALAAVGMASLMVGRPVNRPSAMWPSGRSHAALVELHPLLLGLALASMATALVHFAVIRQHFNEYELYGWFFVAVATGELAWALLAVARPSPALLVIGTAANAVLVATWTVTRAYGSVVGPQATTPAKVGFGDVVSTVLEAAIVLGCLVLLRSGLYRREAPSYRSEVVGMIVALGITLITVLALYSAVGGHPFVSHVG